MSPVQVCLVQTQFILDYKYIYTFFFQNEYQYLYVQFKALHGLAEKLGKSEAQTAKQTLVLSV